MCGRKFSDILLEGRGGDDAAPELLHAPVKGGLDSPVEGDDVVAVGRVAAIETGRVDDVHFDVGVTFEDVDDVFHLRVAAALVEDL